MVKVRRLPSARLASIDERTANQAKLGKNRSFLILSLVTETKLIFFGEYSKFNVPDQEPKLMECCGCREKSL